MSRDFRKNECRAYFHDVFGLEVGHFDFPAVNLMLDNTKRHHYSFFVPTKSRNNVVRNNQEVSVSVASS